MHLVRNSIAPTQCLPWKSGLLNTLVTLLNPKRESEMRPASWLVTFEEKATVEPIYIITRILLERL